jgi:osmotically-inducible protein OsmY
MRYKTMLGVLCVCGLMAGTGCATVKSEVNALEKNPSALKGAEDGALQAAVKAELGKNAMTKAANLDASVKGGVVTLKGTASADVKAAAEKLAKVPGIGGVNNQIALK